MTIAPQGRSRLDHLGDALRAATAADAARTARNRRRRTLAGALAVSAIVLPGAALATQALIGDKDVARSIPHGTLVLMGTHPTCTPVRTGVEFDCVLASAPRAGDVAAGDWDGTVEPTVDRSRRVNGGCRSLNPDGTHWRCYVGREAVEHGIVGAGFLGQPAPSPGRG
jgi:hypothetical protein